ncbi:MAG: LptF/LptG family permease, partial [Bacteroidota bacterium]|nr:LptF/LptG family permease [Bacteroidota bacterium]
LKLTRTPESEFMKAYQMMNLRQLKDSEALTRRQVDSGLQVNYKLVSAYIKYFSVPAKSAAVKHYVPASANPLAGLKINEQVSALINATSEVRSMQDLIKNRSDRHKELMQNIQRAALEYQTKFTLSAACIALFLIGAPLGAIIRKGGLGLPVVVSVVFFLFL